MSKIEYDLRHGDHRAWFVDAAIFDRLMPADGGCGEACRVRHRGLYGVTAAPTATGRALKLTIDASYRLFGLPVSDHSSGVLSDVGNNQIILPAQFPRLRESVDGELTGTPITRPRPIILALTRRKRFQTDCRANYLRGATSRVAARA